MAVRVENSVEELAFLKGCTVKDVRIVENDAVSGEDRLIVTFRLPPTKTAVLVDGKRCREFEYDVWQDAEGNGPGFLALTEARIGTGR